MEVNENSGKVIHKLTKEIFILDLWGGYVYTPLPGSIISNDNIHTRPRRGVDIPPPGSSRNISFVSLCITLPFES